MNIAIIPLISCVVSLVFALAVLDQYFARRKPYQLVWAIGLGMYFISTGTEFWAGTFGISPAVLRLWYLFGAIFVAAYLGMGTLYLLVRRRTGHIIMAILLVASLWGIFAVVTAPVDISQVTTLTGKGFPTYLRLTTPFFNTFGTVALVGGALYSAYIFWRKRILAHRVISNILIAAGAILPALGGTLIRFGGSMNAFYMLELAGIIIIFVGFLRSREVFGLYRVPFSQGLGKVEKTKE